jgi:hypothetical protein
MLRSNLTWRIWAIVEPFERAINESRRQLPAAFDLTEAPPWPSGARIDLYRLAESGYPGAAGADGPPVDRSFEDVEILACIRELGFEALGVYISFHWPLKDERWGIFLYRNTMRALSRRIEQDLKIADSLAAKLVEQLVFRHEMFHFKFDLYALHEKLILGKPLYCEYLSKIYKKVVYTEECYEEALVNLTTIQSARGWKRRLRLPSSPNKHLRKLCENSPPGYSDFDKAPEVLRGGLGGQLIFGKVGQALDYPQSTWLDVRSPFDSESNCPVYLVSNTGDVVPSFTPIIVRQSGGPWRFNRYDADNWPSQPHGHHLETGEKLNITNGEVWKNRKHKSRRITTKELETIHKRLRERWPDVQLPNLVVP